MVCLTDPKTYSQVESLSALPVMFKDIKGTLCLNFFVTSSIFRDEPTFADLSWLWAVITLFLIICTPMWPTYSESWVRALSHGTTHEKFFTKKFSRRGGFSKKRRFWPFLVSPPPQQSKASLLGQFKSQMTSTWLIWSVMGNILMWTLKKWRI